MNQYLLNALESLHIVCNRSSLHPNDEDRVKMYFRVLKQHDIPLDAKGIRAWLQSKEWHDLPIKQVVTWATSIEDGGRVQIKNPNLVGSEAEVWERIQKSR